MDIDMDWNRQGHEESTVSPDMKFLMLMHRLLQIVTAARFAQVRH
jgi:hypothetical protein